MYKELNISPLEGKFHGNAGNRIRDFFIVTTKPRSRTENTHKEKKIAIHYEVMHHLPDNTLSLCNITKKISK